MNFTRKKFLYNNKRLVILLVGWKGKIWSYFYVILALLLNGFDCIVYEYSPDVLSSDINKTILRFDEIVQDIQKTVLWNVKHRNYKEISVFGTSLGTIFSLIVANKNKNIRKIILNLSSSSLAKTVWSWDKIKRGFKLNLIENNISYIKLERYWEKLAPINNLSKLKDKKILFYLAKNDEVVPFVQGMELVRKVSNLKINHKLVINQTGNHILAGFINLLKYPKYISFLKDK